MTESAYFLASLQCFWFMCFHLLEPGKSKKRLHLWLGILLLALILFHYVLFEFGHYKFNTGHVLNGLLVFIFALSLIVKPHPAAGSYLISIAIAIPLSLLYHYLMVQGINATILTDSVFSSLSVHLPSIAVFVPFMLLKIFQYQREDIRKKIGLFFENQSYTQKDSSFYTIESDLNHDLFIDLFEKLKLLVFYSPVAILWVQPEKNSLHFIHQTPHSHDTQIDVLSVESSLQSQLLAQKLYKTQSLFWLDHRLMLLQDFVNQHCPTLLWDVYIPISNKGHALAHFFLKKRESVSSYCPEYHVIQKTVNIVRHAVYTHVFLKQERDIQAMLAELNEKRTYQEDLRVKINDLNQMVAEINKKQTELIAKEKLASISNITVTLHHEINNPLTHILGSSQLIQTRIQKDIPLQPDELLSSMRQILHQTTRICNIIRSLRNLSSPQVAAYLPDIQMIQLNIKPN